MFTLKNYKLDETNKLDSIKISYLNEENNFINVDFAKVNKSDIDMYKSTFDVDGNRFVAFAIRFASLPISHFRDWEDDPDYFSYQLQNTFKNEKLLKLIDLSGNMIFVKVLGFNAFIKNEITIKNDDSTQSKLDEFSFTDFYKLFFYYSPEIEIGKNSVYTDFINTVNYQGLGHKNDNFSLCFTDPYDNYGILDLSFGQIGNGGRVVKCLYALDNDSKYIILIDRKDLYFLANEEQSLLFKNGNNEMTSDTIVSFNLNNYSCCVKAIENDSLLILVNQETLKSNNPLCYKPEIKHVKLNIDKILQNDIKSFDQYLKNFPDERGSNNNQGYSEDEENYLRSVQERNQGYSEDEWNNLDLKEKSRLDMERIVAEADKELEIEDKYKEEIEKENKRIAEERNQDILVLDYINNEYTVSLKILIPPKFNDRKGYTIENVNLFRLNISFVTDETNSSFYIGYILGIQLICVHNEHDESIGILDRFSDTDTMHVPDNDLAKKNSYLCKEDLEKILNIDLKEISNNFVCLYRSYLEHNYGDGLVKNDDIELPF